MIINNVELEDLDFYDADVLEKYENALIDIETKTKNIEKLTRASESIRQQCNIMFDCFNSLFGVDTDVKIFGGKTNLKVCLKAFEELISHANEQRGELDKIFDKYSPNRASRRASKK